MLVTISPTWGASLGKVYLNILFIDALSKFQFGKKYFTQRGQLGVLSTEYRQIQVYSTDFSQKKPKKGLLTDVHLWKSKAATCC